MEIGVQTFRSIWTMESTMEPRTRIRSLCCVCGEVGVRRRERTFEYSSAWSSALPDWTILRVSGTCCNSAVLAVAASSVCTRPCSTAFGYWTSAAMSRAERTHRVHPFYIQWTVRREPCDPTRKERNGAKFLSIDFRHSPSDQFAAQPCQLY